MKLLKTRTARRCPPRFEHGDGATLGVALHRRAKRHHVGNLFDTFPLYVEVKSNLWRQRVEQHAVHGNELERHRSVWTREEFESLGFEILMDGKPDNFYNEMLLGQWTKDGPATMAQATNH